ncbi:hypothetical protein V6N13_033679 [Hibiscus sabdariffa]
MAAITPQTIYSNTRAFACILSNTPTHTARLIYTLVASEPESSNCLNYTESSKQRESPLDPMAQYEGSDTTLMDNSTQSLREDHRYFGIVSQLPTSANSFFSQVIRKNILTPIYVME